MGGTLSAAPQFAHPPTLLWALLGGVGAIVDGAQGCVIEEGTHRGAVPDVHDRLRENGRRWGDTDIRGVEDGLRGGDAVSDDERFHDGF